MEQTTLDVQGLSDAQIQKVKDYIAFLRLNGEQEIARQEIKQLWTKATETATPMSDEEASQLAEEAIAEVRGKAVCE